MKYKILILIINLIYSYTFAGQPQQKKKIVGLEYFQSDNLEKVLASTRNEFAKYNKKDTSALINAIGLSTRGLSYALGAIEHLPNQDKNCNYLIQFAHISFEILKDMVLYIKDNLCLDCKIDNNEKNQITLLTTIFDAIIKTLEDKKDVLRNCPAFKNIDKLLRNLTSTKNQIDKFFTGDANNLCTRKSMFTRKCSLNESDEFKNALEFIDLTLTSLKTNLKAE